MGGTQRHPGHGQGPMRDRSPVIGSSEPMILKLASRSARRSRPTARVRRATKVSPRSVATGVGAALSTIRASP
jgi:hypothetical protein